MKSIVILASIALILFACSSISVKHDYDREANFAALKTFAWMQQPTSAMGDARAAVAHNTFLDKRIRSSVKSQLSAKGFSENSGSPDFLIVYHTGLEDKVEVTDWGYTYAHRGRYWGYVGRNIDVHQYTEGTLILDFVDAKSKQLVWRGSAQKVVDPNPKPEKVEKTIGEAVAKMLENFPPPPGT